MARVRIARIPWRYWRRLTQLVFLGAFLWLFRQTELRGDAIPGYVDLVFRLDPLVAASVMLAAKTMVATLLLSLITVLFTLVFGRAFCGWICPLGTLLDWLGPVFRLFRKKPGTTRRFRPLRYWLLLAVLIGALLGLPLVGYVDPFSLLQQGMVFAIDPALRWGADAGSGWLYNNAPESVTNVSEAVYGFVDAHVLAVVQTAYVGAWVFATILLVIFLLERVQRRFWCRNLCPLGAMLGLIARLAPFGRRPAQACAGCGECAHTCRMGAFDERGRLELQACTVCMDCVDSCPHQIATFLWWMPTKRPRATTTKEAVPVEMSRRGFIGACATGVALPAATAGARTVGLLPPSRTVLRPPGVSDESDFINRCVRCGQCLKVCVTNGLQPVLLEAGPAGVFSPKLAPRAGYCEYNCTLCGDVCPTGAIPQATPETKWDTKIGLAEFDLERCLPYAENKPCIVCEEHCPVPDKAIGLEEVEVTGEDGTTQTLQRPFVRPGRCVGCAICEYVCPVEGPAGVRVRPIGPDETSVDE